MTSLDDFRKEDGHIDWDAYKKEEINNGERCFNCDNFIGFGRGEKRMCYSCSNISKKDSLDHSHLIRCPKCKNTWDINDGDDYDFFSEGEHSTSCPECNFQFEIITSVEYTFESPELLDEEMGK